MNSRARKRAIKTAERLIPGLIDAIKRVGVMVRVSNWGLDAGGYSHIPTEWKTRRLCKTFAVHQTAPTESAGLSE